MPLDNFFPHEETRVLWNRFEGLIDQQVIRLRIEEEAASYVPSSLCSLSSSRTSSCNLLYDINRNGTLTGCLQRNSNALFSGNMDGQPLCGLPYVARSMSPLLSLIVVCMQEMRSINRCTDSCEAYARLRESKQGLFGVYKKALTLESQLHQYINPSLVTTLNRRSAKATFEAELMCKMIDKLRKESRKSATEPERRKKVCELTMKLKSLLSRQKCEWQCVGRLKETLTMAREMRGVLKFICQLSCLLEQSNDVLRQINEGPPPYDYCGPFDTCKQDSSDDFCDTMDMLDQSPAQCRPALPSQSEVTISLSLDFAPDDRPSAECLTGGKSEDNDQRSHRRSRNRQKRRCTDVSRSELDVSRSTSQQLKGEALNGSSSSRRSSRSSRRTRSSSHSSPRLQSSGSRDICSDARSNSLVSDKRLRDPFSVPSGHSLRTSPTRSNKDDSLSRRSSSSLKSKSLHRSSYMSPLRASQHLNKTWSSTGGHEGSHQDDNGPTYSVHGNPRDVENKSRARKDSHDFRKQISTESVASMQDRRSNSLTPQTDGHLQKRSSPCKLLSPPSTQRYRQGNINFSPDPVMCGGNTKTFVNGSDKPARLSEAVASETLCNHLSDIEGSRDHLPESSETEAAKRGGNVRGKLRRTNSQSEDRYFTKKCQHLMESDKCANRRVHYSASRGSCGKYYMCPRYDSSESSGSREPLLFSSHESDLDLQHNCFSFHHRNATFCTPCIMLGDKYTLYDLCKRAEKRSKRHDTSTDDDDIDDYTTSTTDSCMFPQEVTTSSARSRTSIKRSVTPKERRRSVDQGFMDTEDEDLVQDLGAQDQWDNDVEAPETLKEDTFDLQYYETDDQLAELKKDASPKLSAKSGSSSRRSSQHSSPSETSSKITSQHASRSGSTSKQISQQSSPSENTSKLISRYSTRSGSTSKLTSQLSSLSEHVEEQVSGPLTQIASSYSKDTTHHSTPNEQTDNRASRRSSVSRSSSRRSSKLSSPNETMDFQESKQSSQSRSLSSKKSSKSSQRTKPSDSSPPSASISKQSSKLSNQRENNTVSASQSPSQSDTGKFRSTQQSSRGSTIIEAGSRRSSPSKKGSQKSRQSFTGDDTLAKDSSKDVDSPQLSVCDDHGVGQVASDSEESDITSEKDPIQPQRTESCKKKDSKRPSEISMDVDTPKIQISCLSRTCSSRPSSKCRRPFWQSSDTSPQSRSRCPCLRKTWTVNCGCTCLQTQPLCVAHPACRCANRSAPAACTRVRDACSTGTYTRQSSLPRSLGSGQHPSMKESQGPIGPSSVLSRSYTPPASVAMSGHSQQVVRTAGSRLGTETSSHLSTEDGPLASKFDSSGNFPGRQPASQTTILQQLSRTYQSSAGQSSILSQMKGLQDSTPEQVYPTPSQMHPAQSELRSLPRANMSVVSGEQVYPTPSQMHPAQSELTRSLPRANMSIVSGVQVYPTCSQIHPAQSELTRSLPQSNLSMASGEQVYPTPSQMHPAQSELTSLPQSNLSMASGEQVYPTPSQMHPAQSELTTRSLPQSNLSMASGEQVYPTPSQMHPAQSELTTGSLPQSRGDLQSVGSVASSRKVSMAETRGPSSILEGQSEPMLIQSHSSIVMEAATSMTGRPEFTRNVSISAVLSSSPSSIPQGTTPASEQLIQTAASSATRQISPYGMPELGITFSPAESSGNIPPTQQSSYSPATQTGGISPSLHTNNMRDSSPLSQTSVYPADKSGGISPALQPSVLSAHSPGDVSPILQGTLSSPAKTFSPMQQTAQSPADNPSSVTRQGSPKQSVLSSPLQQAVQSPADNLTSVTRQSSPKESVLSSPLQQASQTPLGNFSSVPRQGSPKESVFSSPLQQAPQSPADNLSSLVHEGSPNESVVSITGPRSKVSTYSKLASILSGSPKKLSKPGSSAAQLTQTTGLSSPSEIPASRQVSVPGSHLSQANAPGYSSTGDYVPSSHTVENAEAVGETEEDHAIWWFVIPLLMLTILILYYLSCYLTTTAGCVGCRPPLPNFFFYLLNSAMHSVRLVHFSPAPV